MGEWGTIVVDPVTGCEKTIIDTGYENIRIWSVMGTETFWNPPAGVVLDPKPAPVKGPLKFKSIAK